MVSELGCPKIKSTMDTPQLVKSFRDFVNREQLFSKTDKLLLACSGGLDSTVLAHLLHAEGYDFAIAHMNFQLRGEASDGDAAFVEELARTLGAKFFMKAVDVKEEAFAGESTQMTARRLRYDWFTELILKQELDMILTAHHSDDNLETTLINLLRGTGINGLAGIPPKTSFLRRPLLESGREAVEAYARNQGLSWREDASNATDDYLRNRIRHHLTPMLYNEFGLKPENWAKTASNIRAATTLYNNRVSDLHSRFCESRGTLWIVNRAGWVREELATFLHEQVYVYEFTNDQIQQMLHLPGQRTLESDRAIVYITPERLVFELKSSIDRRQPPKRTIRELPQLDVRRGYHTLSLELLPRPEVLDKENAQYLAPQNLPLHLRPRKKGDRFQPLGMGGKTKKVKDYMIDQKIPVWLRDRIYLLTNDNDEILAIPGYCISEKFKVLPEHDEVLKISVI